MKKILLIIGVAGFSFAYGQRVDKPWLKPILQKDQIQILCCMLPAPKPDPTISALIPATIFYALPSGKIIYSQPPSEDRCFSTCILFRPGNLYPPQKQILPFTTEKLKELRDYLTKKTETPTN